MGFGETSSNRFKSLLELLLGAERCSIALSVESAINAFSAKSAFLGSKTHFSLYHRYGGRKSGFW